MWEDASRSSHFMYSGLITNAFIGDRVKSNSSSFLYGCSNLNSLSIGGSVQSIGAYAFMYSGLWTADGIGERVKRLSSHRV